METELIQDRKLRARIGKMEARMNHWGAKLELLAAQADSSDSATAGGIHKHIDVLIMKHRTARSKLEELRSTPGGGFDALSKQLDTFWIELESGIKDLSARLKDDVSRESIAGVSSNPRVSEKADDR